MSACTTPRSGDSGRDIIATHGDGTRILDQVKAFAPHRRVTADDIRAMIGVLSLDANVSKAYITTTSTFAPEIGRDEAIARVVPSRLELRDRHALLVWLSHLANPMSPTSILETE